MFLSDILYLYTYYCDVYAFTMVLKRVDNDDDWIYEKKKARNYELDRLVFI